MIDYTSVTRELRSVISRRREMLTFLGSVFAAMGIFLQNSLQGALPGPLRALQDHIFAFYAFLLLVPSLLIALRLTRLNVGMTINGVFYARLMMEQDFTRRAPPEAIYSAARINPFGVSFLMFVLSAVIASFAAALLSLALSAALWLALVVGVGVFLVWLGLYLLFHRSAAAFAIQKAQTDSCAPFERNEWEAHVAGSLEDSNHDMIAILGLCGLIVFSVFEGLSGLGQLAGNTDLRSNEVDQYGPAVYSLLMLLTCFLSMITYLRLRVAVGQRSLDIDPTDQPFKPLRLTDSLLGYMLLSFFFAVAVHFLFESTLFSEKHHFPLLLAIDAGAFLLAILAEQLTLVYLGRIIKPR